MQSKAAFLNECSILKYVFLLQLVSHFAVYANHCNSTHINYCNRVNRPSSYSYTVYESVQQTYTETYYYKCGFHDWYTCTGNRSRNYSTLVPVTETVYFNTTLRECCDNNATCEEDEEMFDIRFTARPGYSNSYDAGVIQICLEGLWRYIEYGNEPLKLCNNIKRQYSTYARPTSGTDSFGRLSFGSETNIEDIDYTLIHGGYYYYLRCESSYVCTDGCVNGQCTDREKCSCNSGWTGKTCDIATCASCVHGQCTGPNSCSCHTGWSGSDCNTAVCSLGCVNGVCVLPDACQCNPGYTGDTCNIRISTFIEHPDAYSNNTAGDTITLSCSVIETESTNQLKWIFVRNTTETELSASSNNIDISNSINGAGAVSVSNLTISDIDLSNTGTYACQHRHTYSSTTHVDIEYPVNVTVYPCTIIAPTSVVEQTFICKGYGYPLPELEWMREDEFSSEDLLNDDNYTIIERTEVSPLGYKIAVSELIITYYDNTTIGNYICQGYNNVTDLVEAIDEATVSFYLEEPPMVELSSPPTVVMLVNESIKISFTVYLGLPKAKLAWTFKQSNDSFPVVLQSNSVIRISDDLHSVFIASLDYKHEGVYTLTLCNRVECSYNSIELIVDAPPAISTIVSSDMGMVSPANISINCVASIGKPVPLVQWIFNNRIIGMGYGSNNITFNVTSFEDGGRYTCKAENIHGITNKSLPITVQDPPVFAMSPNDTNGVVFGAITLVCRAYGYPLPDIEWLKDNISLEGQTNISSSGDHEEGSGSMKYIIWSNSTIGGIYEITSYLTIVNLSHTDRGQYQCMASNSLVIDTVNTSLPATVDVMYPPNVFQPLVNVTVNTSDNLSLICSISGHPIPNITWWFKQQDNIEYRIELSDRIRAESMECVQYSSYDECQQSLLTVVNVSKSDTGTYTCRGANEIPDINGVYTNFTSAYVFVQVPPIVMLASEPIIEAVVGHNEYVLINFTISDDIPSVQPNNTLWCKTNTTGTFLLPFGDGKYSFSHDRTLLNITNLQYTDRGNYTMMALNEAGVDEATITLYLEVEPLLLNSTGAKVDIIIPGNITNMYFNCSADGIPVPVLQWYKDGSLLLNTSRYLITYTTNNITDTIRSGFIPEIQLAHSSLNLSNLRETDTGIYECRADNSAGETKVVKNRLNIIDNYVPVCQRRPDICNMRGTCIDTGRDTFYCDCDDGYTGTTCDTKIFIEVAAVITKIESSIGNDVGEVVTPPTDVAGFLLQPLTLTCHAAGIPIPKVVWKSRNESFMVTGSSLTFEEIKFADRGFYRCEVSNKLNSVVSQEIRVYIASVYQYRVRFKIAGLQSSNALSLLRQALSGSLFPDKQTQFLSIDLISTGNTNKRSIVSDISTMVTIQSKKKGSDALASALLDHMITRLEQKAVLVKPYDELPDRFDGCRSENTLVSSVSNKDLDFNITWPEANLGESVTLPCPCGGLDLQSSALVAIRMCGGNYSAGAKWEEPNIQPCNFTDSIRRLCQLAMQEPAARVNALGELTEDASEFQNTEVTVAVAVLLSAIANVTGDRNETESFLNVISNLLKPSEEVLLESKSTANTLGRMLEALEVVTSGLSGSYSSEEDDIIIIPFDGFVVSVQKYDNATPPFISTIKAFKNDSDDNTMCTTEQLLCQSEQNPSAEVTLPQQVFNYTDEGNVSANAISSVVFFNDALFLRSDKMYREVSSVIVSVSVIGADNITGLESPVVLVFQMSRSSILENASDPICSFWDPTLDDNYGDWSSVGCELVSVENITNSSDDVLFTCHCNHLTSFTVLMDVSYEEVEPPKTHFDFVLSVYTFIGCIASTICLVIAVISHLANKKLRHSEHGLLVVNLSLSLIGVYSTFIGAVYAVHIPVVCIVVAALLQYFFLVAFLIMGFEAIELYRKTVRVFVSKQTMKEFIIKIIVSCWVLPLLIVGFCLAPDYNFYISKTQAVCRAQRIPFYIGTIVPFLIIYIFNWIMFAKIFIAIVKRSTGESTISSGKLIKHRLRTAVVLSVIFGLGWGLGLPATQAQNNDILRYLFSIGFNTLTAFQGTMIFFLHCVNSNEIRKEWSRWFSCIVKKKRIADMSFRSSSLSQQKSRNFKDLNMKVIARNVPSIPSSPPLETDSTTPSPIMATTNGTARKNYTL